MYALIAGGGKAGANVARSLLRMGHEVTLIEQRPDRFHQLEEEFEHQVQLGDATELFVLERAGIRRPPDIVLALTGDDEDNLIICQIAKERFGVPKTIARVNDPRNQVHFDLLGISPTVCATCAMTRFVLSPFVATTTASASSIPAARRMSMSIPCPTMKPPVQPVPSRFSASSFSSTTETSQPSRSSCFAIDDPTRPQPITNTFIRSG